MIPCSVKQGVMVIPHSAQDIVLIPHSYEEIILEIPHYAPFFYIS